MTQSHVSTYHRQDMRLKHVRLRKVLVTWEARPDVKSMTTYLVILQKESWFKRIKPSTRRALFFFLVCHFINPSFASCWNIFWSWPRGRRVTKCLVFFRDPAQWKSGGWLEDQELLRLWKVWKHLSSAERNQRGTRNPTNLSFDPNFFGNS